MKLLARLMTKAGKANTELRETQAKVAKLSRKLKAVRAEIGAIPASEKSDYFAEIEAEKRKKTTKKEEPKEEKKEEETKEVEPIT